MSKTISESGVSRDGAEPTGLSEDASPSPATSSFGPRSARSGKLPRSQATAERERTDPDFARRLTAARKELAKAIGHGGVESLRTLRLQRGLSQAQLAAQLGISQSHLAKIEAGQVAD